jgi:hypothetical protein
MPISSRVNRPLERRGAGGPLAELSIGVNGALEDAGEEDGRRGGPRAAADVEESPRLAVAHERKPVPGRCPVEEERGQGSADTQGVGKGADIAARSRR